MKKTQGQRREGRVRVIAILAFLGLTGVGVYGYQAVMGSAYEWVDSHAEATGTVVDLTEEKDEYRNLKGRKRTSTDYYVEYTFEVDGEIYENYEDISRSEYNSMSAGDSLSIWYDPVEPDLNAMESKVAGGSATSLSTALVFIAPFTFGFAFGLYRLLCLFFVRESRKKLSEGFYTDNSWLDVDDNKLVLLNSKLVLMAEFGSGHSKDITKAYQNGASHKELTAMLKAKQTETLVLSNITSISSRHDEDKIHIEAGEQSLALDFLNMGTKEHALEKLEAFLPDTLTKTVVKRSRLRAAMPRLVVMGILGAIGVALGGFAVWLVLGAVALLMIMPDLVRRLLDPTVLTTFVANENAATAVVDEDVKKAA